MPRAQRAGRRTAGRIVATLIAGAAALPALVNAQTADVASGRWSVVDRSAVTEWERHLRDLRSLYFAALDDATLVRHGHTAVTGARVAMPVGVEDGPLLNAYEGAFTALEARHGSWPIARYLRVRDALRLLDAAVGAAPDHLEIRYLRMINVYHLPSLFGRGDQAADDLALLTRGLPDAASCHPPMVYRAMAAFVLEHGAPAAREREVLARALRRLDTRPLGEEDSHE